MANRIWPQSPARWLLRLSGLLLIFAVGWFALGMVRIPPSTVIAWLPVPVSALLAAAQCWMAGTGDTVVMEARRYWRTTCLAVVLIGAASMASIFEPAPLGGVLIGPVAMAVYCVAVGVVLWGLLRLPFGMRSRQQRLTLWYDLGTVMLAVALFTAHFGGRSMAGGGFQATPQRLVSLAVIILGFVLVFALTKAALTAAHTVDRRSLRLLAIGAVGSCTGSSLGPLLIIAPHLNVGHYTVPFAMFFTCWAAYAQRHDGAVPLLARGGSQRPFALLPYVAVAATDGLLLITTLRGDSDTVMVAGGAVALTAVVVVRQLTSFRENARLLVRLARHERRFRSLVQHSSDIISITTAEGTIRYLSPSVERVLGVAAEPWTGQSVLRAVHPDDREIVRGAIAAIIGVPNTTTTYEVRLAHRDGSWRWAEVISSNLLDDPSVHGIVSNARDITEEREFQDRLRHEATHDPLTGLANRARFAERVSQALADPDRHDVAVALIDLNGFKEVNDSYGHAVGDSLLTAVAVRVRDSVAATDTVARLGGDEFAVLLSDTSARAVDLILRRIHREIVKPLQTDGRELFVGASIGVATAVPGERPDELLHRADIAMYASKSRRDGIHTYYTPALAASSVDRPDTAQIREALDHGQLRLFYQPVVSLPDGALTGVEALVRWEHPERGLLAPDQFVPTAEKTSLIIDLGDWVLRTACEQQAAWLRAFDGDAPQTVAVNVSPRQLRERDFAARVRSLLLEHGLEPARLVLEITESAAVAGGDTDANLAALHELGVHLSLDDFGTGQSTLSLLHRLPVSEVKLDRSFTAGSTGGTAGGGAGGGADGPRRSVAQALVAMADALDLTIVAEGVETPEQAVQLFTMGYRRAQGYHFDRPMPAHALTEKLADGRLPSPPAPTRPDLPMVGATAQE